MQHIRKIYLIIILTAGLLAPFDLLYAQDENSCEGSESRRAEKFFEKAMDRFKSDPDKANAYLIKAIEKDEYYADAYYMLAQLNFRQFNNSISEAKRKHFREQALQLIEHLLTLCPQYNDYYMNFVAGRILYKQDEKKKALKYLKRFTQHVQDSSKSYFEAVGMIEKTENVLRFEASPVPYDPIPVEGICTENDEYLPMISPDGSMAFYTMAYLKKHVNNIYGQKFTEEFRMAQAADTTGVHFKNAKPMSSPFNQGKNQGAVSISIDNSKLYLTICEFVSRDYKNCDIFVAHRNSGYWGELKNLGPNINGKYTWESQPSISPDGNTIYFASIRESNIGFDPENPTSDIYVSHKDSTGSWSKAKNLGAPINTKGNEKSPFFHSDNQTLYFASDKHPGVGGYDIFFSQFKNNKWAEIQNIGYPINTEENDLSLIVSTAGDKAYFASNKIKKGSGGWDIYAFTLHEEARPEDVLFVKGHLETEKGTRLRNARVEIKNVETNDVHKGLVNDETGDYAVAVAMEERDEEYIMVVKREGYSFTSKYIKTEELKTEFPEEVDFEVTPIETGQSVKINDIHFEFASATLDTSSKIVLDNFIEFLEDNPTLEFEVHGHTDNVGNAANNLRLSRARAKSVYAYLAEKGIDQKRMAYQGFGEKRPVATNETEEGRALNRRTEFFIVTY